MNWVPDFNINRVFVFSARYTGDGGDHMGLEPLALERLTIYVSLSMASHLRSFLCHVCWSDGEIWRRCWW